MNKMPLDSQLDPEKIEAILLINKMLKTIEDPNCDDASREVLLTTVIVNLMSAIAALIFALVDLLIRSGIQSVLNIFG